MTPNARKDNLIVQELADELLVYDLKKHKAICLNKTSAMIWLNCDGNSSVTEIAKSVETKLGKPVSDEIVLFALDQLNKSDLLEFQADYSNSFEGLSRREIIKKVGLATAIALPIVSSLTAPMAIHAQSCPPAGTGMADIPAGSGCPCLQPQDCSGGSCMAGTMTC